ncbi:hypothetical protein NL478_27790, partial [Klebsiella pneumoniae]|nr:hypothetical protein [Klebsiella pneumoniae]
LTVLYYYSSEQTACKQLALSDNNEQIGSFYIEDEYFKQSILAKTGGIPYSCRVKPAAIT